MIPPELLAAVTKETTEARLRRAEERERRREEHRSRFGRAV